MSLFKGFKKLEKIKEEVSMEDCYETMRILNNMEILADIPDNKQTYPAETAIKILTIVRMKSKMDWRSFMALFARYGTSFNQNQQLRFEEYQKNGLITYSSNNGVEWVFKE